MNQETITALLIAVGVYMLLGLLVGVPFAFFGAHRIDEHARSTRLPFRLMIIPGSAALWPIVLALWLRARRGNAA
ncbi:MAG: hypothetical protein AAGD00_06760 [Planctomycetota bacterium]